MSRPKNKASFNAVLPAVLQNAKRSQMHRAMLQGASESLMGGISQAILSQAILSQAMLPGHHPQPGHALKNEKRRSVIMMMTRQSSTSGRIRSESIIITRDYEAASEPHDEQDQGQEHEEEWDWCVKEKLPEKDDEKEEERGDEKVEQVDAEGEAWEWYSRLVERGVRNLRPLFFEGRAVFVGGSPSSYTVLRNFPGLVVNCQG